MVSPLYEKCRTWALSQWKIIAAAGLVAVAGTVAYGNSFSVPFVFDSLQAIPCNSSIRHLWPVGEVLLPSSETSNVSDRPLINLSFALNFALSGTRVWSYHLVNLLIHVLAGITLMGVVRRTILQPVLRDRFGQSALPLALVIALLWTVHPLQTESVTNIVQRCESLMSLFYLLTLYAFIRGADKKGKSYWLPGSVAACFLGAVSKEIMITAPLMVLIYDRTFVAGTFGKALMERRSYYAGLFCSWFLLAWMMVRAGTRSESVGIVPGLTPQLYLLNQFDVLLHYIRLTFWPYPQVFDYGPPVIHHLNEVGFAAAIILLLVAGTLFAMRRAPAADSRWRTLGFPGCWFFLILAPTSSLVPVKDVMVEHRMYLPLASLLALVVFGAYAGWRWKGVTLVALLVPVCMVLTLMRNNDYRSALALWKDTVTKRPDNERAHINLALELTQMGRMNEALEQYRQAIRMSPDDSMAHSNMAAPLRHLGRMAEAEEQCGIALKLDPHNGSAHVNLGMVLASQGQIAEAMKEFETAIQDDSRNAEAHNNLGALLIEKGRIDEAILQYKEALKINPDYADAHAGLGLALGMKGRFDEAAEQFNEVLDINPQDAEAHYDLGIVLTKLGRIREAMEQYQAALEIQPGYTHARENLRMLQLQAAPK